MHAENAIMFIKKQQPCHLHFFFSEFPLRGSLFRDSLQFSWRLFSNSYLQKKKRKKIPAPCKNKLKS